MPPVKIDTPVSDTDPATAPADGMARFMASRQAHDQPHALIDHPAAVEEPEPLPDEKPIPTEEKPPVAAKAGVDDVLDPETGDPIENPTRNDRRLSKLWKREQAAITENKRLLAIIEQRNAAPLADTTVQTAGRPDAQALASDQQLTAAAKARLRKEPDEGEIGKTYSTYEAFVKDCAIYGGELAVAKAAIVTEQKAAQAETKTNQELHAKHYAEQGKLYPDFAERIADAASILNFQYLGPQIADVVMNSPEQAGNLAYWIATHADDVSRIRALAPGRQLLEMGKVMAGLNAPSATTEAGGASRRTSRAPAPTRELGRPAGHASDRPEDATNYAEFEARRTPQVLALAARRR